MVGLKKYFPYFFATLLFVFFACGADEREEYESKLKTRLGHHPPKTHVGNTPIRIPIFVNANYTIEDSTARIFYRAKAATDSIAWRSMNLKSAQQDTMFAILTPAKKGVTWEYFFQIDPPTGDAIKLPRQAPEKTYEIIFKGHAATWLKISHLFLSHLTIIIMLLAGFYAWRIIAKSYPINYTIWFLFSGCITFVTGTILLGIWLKWQVYGVLWQGFPFGTDTTDFFSTILMIYWVICLLGVKDFLLRRPWPKFWYADKTFAYLTLAGAACYIIVGIFAHHL